MDGNSASLIAFALAVFLIVLIGVIIMISKDRPTEKPSQRSARDRHEANGGRVSYPRSNAKPTIYDFMARVRVGDKIWMEYNRWHPKIGAAKCVNNNPHLKKMRVWWEWSEQAQAQGHPKSESIILSYDSKELENFELLNPKYCQPEQPQQPEKPKEETKEEKVARLNVELEDAIKEEKFEKAVEITKEIDKLTSTEI